MRIFLSLLVLIILSAKLTSQSVVTRNDSVKVWHGSKLLKLAWASGMNSGQINHIDLNSDGKKDLFILENNFESNFSTGDKTYTFINQGGSGSVNYRFAPEYRSFFPRLEEFAILRDYDCDGREDIFTRDPSSRFAVFKNTGTTTPAFTLVKRTLITDTSNVPYNPAYFHYGEIYWGFHDLPSITDFDGDGDLDILSAPVNPHFIEYNKNLSKEKYGTCDSLVFELKNTCWGQVLEDIGTVALNMCDIVNVPDPENTSSGSSQNQKSGLHSQDAMLALDLNGDSVMDLLEGDYERRFLYSMINGGSKDSSHITTYTTAYPAVDSFQASTYALPFHLDINNDQKADLLVSVYSDRLQDTSSLWYYENKGTATFPSFELVTKNFLLEEMLDVGTQSKPVFFDYNGDSLLDMVIGNLGYFSKMSTNPYLQIYRSQLALYENIGSLKVPEFKLIDTNYANLPSYPLNIPSNKATIGCHPTFGDLDMDGDEDMMIGDFRGKIHYFENNPAGGKANFTLGLPEFLGIDVGDYSTPQLFDLEGDGKLDLLIGNEEGTITYYKNTTISTLDFTLISDSLGEINVKEDWDWVGYSTPYFFIDSLGVTKLISGSKAGHYLLYDSIIHNGSLTTKFRMVTNRYESLWEGIYSTIHGGDLDGDSKVDFVLGNQSGGLTLFTSGISDSSSIVTKYRELENIVMKLYPNPAKSELQVSVNCKCNDQFSYTVYNTLGTEILRKSGGSAFVIDLSGIEPGLYFVRAENEKRTMAATMSFIKSH